MTRSEHLQRRKKSPTPAQGSARSVYRLIATWRGAGAAERTGFENQRGVLPRRGFKSLPLRHVRELVSDELVQERCLSGLRSTLGKRVCRFPAPRVQIPPSPPSLGRAQGPRVGPVLATGQGRTGSGQEWSSPKITDACVSDRALSRASPAPLYSSLRFPCSALPLSLVSAQASQADRLLP